MNSYREKFSAHNRQCGEASLGIFLAIKPSSDSIRIRIHIRIRIRIRNGHKFYRILANATSTFHWP